MQRLEEKRVVYSKLYGICKKALENNWCLGCQKLENPTFTGQIQCDLVKDPAMKSIRRCKEILGIKEK